jgi:hypothetical protein
MTAYGQSREEGYVNLYVKAHSRSLKTGHFVKDRSPDPVILIHAHHSLREPLVGPWWIR